MPGEFIDIAEDTGLIVRLGELVIDKVCSQINGWKKMRLEVPPVSVNVSPHQLKVGNVSSYLAACLRRHDVEANLVEVELTESAVIDESRIVVQELQELRNLGIKLMIDDFGTGHSSLAQLHRLDVDALKVDKAFTDALIGDGHEGQVLFQAIVSMANALNICVVAEGVETLEQLSLLRKIDCDEAQGFLFSEAVPGEAVMSLIAQHSA